MKVTIFAAAALLVVAGLTHVETQTQSAAATARASQAAAGAQATLERYCVTCHNARAQAGGLSLDSLQVTAASRDPQTWEKVVRKVRTGMMPPAGMPRP